ncbi:hypothetical protein MVEG_06572 [Podila verticillata NRRL 6337]|nr:hypothetical protein MVEG_06572 [Podila verticillata NRRL 6337]
MLTKYTQSTTNSCDARSARPVPTPEPVLGRRGRESVLRSPAGDSVAVLPDRTAEQSGRVLVRGAVGALGRRTGSDPGGGGAVVLYSDAKVRRAAGLHGQ